MIRGHPNSCSNCQTAETTTWQHDPTSCLSRIPRVCERLLRSFVIATRSSVRPDGAAREVQQRSTAAWPLFDDPYGLPGLLSAGARTLTRHRLPLTRSSTGSGSHGPQDRNACLPPSLGHGLARTPTSWFGRDDPGRRPASLRPTAECPEAVCPRFRSLAVRQLKIGRLTVRPNAPPHLGLRLPVALR